MPPPAAPTTYQSYTPLQSYRDLASQLAGFREESNRLKAERYRVAGTPAEQAVAARGRELTPKAEYLASLPLGDRFLAESTGFSDPYSGVRMAGQMQFDQAKSAYEQALSKIGEQPVFEAFEEPDWAKQTISADPTKKKTPLMINVEDMNTLNAPPAKK